MRLIVLGAGVIGCVYAARLSETGHDVTVVARGERADGLARRGIHVANETRTARAFVRVVREVREVADERFDYALLAVRYDQLDQALDAAAQLRAGALVTLCNLPFGAGSEGVLRRTRREDAVSAPERAAPIETAAPTESVKPAESVTSTETGAQPESAASAGAAARPGAGASFEAGAPSATAALVGRVGMPVVRAFPGVGGQMDEAGRIRYAHVPQQNTTVERVGGREDELVAALRRADFAVDVEPQMGAWLSTHAAFIVGLGAGILLAGGRSEDLARVRRATARTVRAIGDAFRALDAMGQPPAPAALRTIFSPWMRLVAVPYWRRQLAATVGTATIAPHVRATRHTELPTLASALRAGLGGRAPRYRALLESAGL